MSRDTLRGSKLVDNHESFRLLHSEKTYCQGKMTFYTVDS